LEAKKIEELFIEAEWFPMESVEKSDLIVYHTCGYSGEKISRTLKIIEEFIERKQASSRIIVSGCLPIIYKKALESFGKEILGFMDFNFDKLYVSDCVENAIDLRGADAYHLVVASGCNNVCSFCSIRKARGRLRSKPMREIVKEFGEAIGAGYRRFYLWADDLGAYGTDIGETFPQLLAKLIFSQPRELEYCFYLFRCNAQWVIHYYEGLERVLKLGKVKQLYIPVQSGSDKILKLMGRNYVIEDVKRCFLKLREEFPNLNLGVYMLVGFPGETEEDFEKTKEFLESIDYNEILIGNYTEVVGTPSYYLDGKVPAEVRHKRQTILRGLKNELQKGSGS